MKRSIINAFGAIVIIMAFVSCQSNMKSRSSDNGDSDASYLHSAKNSLDWSGSYSGILPCASCEGIDTELQLKEDMTYTLITKYLGKGEEPHTISGSFEWMGNNVKLNGIAGNDRPSMYKVEENRLRQLDLEGNIITGNLERNYILTKNGNLQAENKKWILTELNGQKVDENPETHYIVLHTDKNRLEAKAGCNVMLYTYRIQNTFRLTIYPGISTLMACPDGSLEPALKDVLSRADNLSVNNDELTLNKARMAPLARFRLDKSRD